MERNSAHSSTIPGTGAADVVEEPVEPAAGPIELGGRPVFDPPGEVRVGDRNAALGKHLRAFDRHCCTPEEPQACVGGVGVDETVTIEVSQVADPAAGPTPWQSTNVAAVPSESSRMLVLL